jgi:competence protein ComEC
MGSRAARRAWWSLGACAVGVWIGTGGLAAWAGIEIGMVVWFATSCAMVAAGVFVKGRWRGVMMVCAVGCLMGGYAGVRTGVVDADRIDVLVGVDGGGPALVRVRGVLVEGLEWGEGRREDWEPSMWAGERGRCVVRVEEVWDGAEWRGASGLVRVSVGSHALGAEGFGVGDVLEIEGKMKGNVGARNVGDRDWGRWANMEGRAGRIAVSGGGSVVVVGEREGVWWSVLRARGVVRDRAVRALGLNETKEDASSVVLGALLLGERAEGSGGQEREVERGFARVGVGHVLAVSGFHVAVLVGMCVLFVRVVHVERWFGDRLGSRLGGWVEVVVVCGALLMMWVLVPMRVPMVRAMVLIGVLMVSRGLGRRYDTMAVLGWVAIGLLVWRPMDVLTMGYQLSVGVTGLLVWMNRSREAGLGIRDEQERVGVVGWVWTALKVNGACWLLAMPVVMWHVGVVSVVGVVMAVVVALMAGVLMAAGYVQVVVGVVWPTLGEETVVVVEWMARVVAGFVGWVDGFGGGGWTSVRGVNLGAGWTIAATGVIWVLLVRAKWLTNKRVVVACVVLLVWGGVEYRARAYVEGVRVEMVDVGDGSAYLVRSGWESVLYDCGSLDYRVGSTVERVAWARGVRRIDSVIVSHDNLDHFNGLVDLARAGIGYERVYVGSEMNLDGSRAWSAVRAELEGYGVEVVVMERGDSFVFGDALVTCVEGGKQIEGGTENDTSLVVRFDAGEGAVLMTGDIGARGVAGIDDGDLEGVVVMELPHHGSVSGSASALRSFVELVNPGVVLQSTGPERVDGRWEDWKIGRAWYASAEGGGAWVQVGSDGSLWSGWAFD